MSERVDIDTRSPTTPLLEVRNLCKYYGNVIALNGITTTVRAGQVTCVLGDNGAGKSTFIKILSGVHQPSDGESCSTASRSRFASPRDALDAGIATVYQDLAVVPLMSVWRNFWLGDEPRRGVRPVHAGSTSPQAKRIAKDELAKMGIDIRDTEQPVGTLSGGERQSVAIARAAYFGARVLILDEPTSALGVKQSGVVLKYVVAGGRARPRRDLHHPQPAPRLSGRRPVPDPQPRPVARQLRQGGDHPGGADRADGRRRRARAAAARARTQLPGPDRRSMVTDLEL